MIVARLLIKKNHGKVLINLILLEIPYSVIHMCIIIILYYCSTTVGQCPSNRVEIDIHLDERLKLLAVVSKI